MYLAPSQHHHLVASDTSPPVSVPVRPPPSPVVSERDCPDMTFGCQQGGVPKTEEPVPTVGQSVHVEEYVLQIAEQSSTSNEPTSLSPPPVLRRSNRLRHPTKVYDPATGAYVARDT